MQLFEEEIAKLEKHLAGNYEEDKFRKICLVKF